MKYFNLAEVNKFYKISILLDSSIPKTNRRTNKIYTWYKIYKFYYIFFFQCICGGNECGGGCTVLFPIMKIWQIELLENFMAPFMDGSQLSQSYRANKERQFTSYL